MSEKNLDKISRFAKAIPKTERTILRKMKVLGLAFFKDRFRQQGWIDRVFIPWKKRRDGESQSRKFGQQGRIQGRAILVKSGDLRASIEGQLMSDSVLFKSDLPYSRIHNDGGTINHPGGTPFFVKDGETIFVSNKKAKELAERKIMLRRTKPHKIKIPRRRYMGPSQFLMERIIEPMAEKEILGAWRKA